MSHQTNDEYFEELQEAEQEFADEQKSYEDALEEMEESARWISVRRKNLESAKSKLQKLKNKI